MKRLLKISLITAIFFCALSAIYVGAYGLYSKGNVKGIQDSIKKIDETSLKISKDDTRNLQWLEKVNPLDYAYYKIVYNPDITSSKNVEKKVKFMSGKYLFPGDSGYARIEGKAFGELDNDGKYEAVTMKFANEGGSGSFPELVVLKEKSERQYEEMASVFEPSDFFEDRIYVKSMEINNKIITVKIMGKGPKDAGCCPTVPMEMKFKLINNKIVEVK